MFVAGVNGSSCIGRIQIGGANKDRFKDVKRRRCNSGFLCNTPAAMIIDQHVPLPHILMFQSEELVGINGMDHQVESVLSASGFSGEFLTARIVGALLVHVTIPRVT